MNHIVHRKCVVADAEEALDELPVVRIHLTAFAPLEGEDKVQKLTKRVQLKVLLSRQHVRLQRTGR